MTETKKHILTFIVTFAIWLIFLIAGIPSDYYQLWPLGALIGLCIFVFILIFPLAYFVLIRIWKDKFFKSSLWIAFYASVPLMLYDYIYIGIIKGDGYSFVFSHWYLSIFYVIVWIQIPFLGWVVDKYKINKRSEALK